MFLKGFGSMVYIALLLSDRVICSAVLCTPNKIPNSRNLFSIFLKRFGAKGKG